MHTDLNTQEDPALAAPLAPRATGKGPRWATPGGEPPTYVVPNGVLLDRGLTVTARELLLRLERKARSSRIARVSYAELMDGLGAGRRAFNYSIDALYGRGRGGRTDGVAYLVTHSPEGFELAPRPELGVRGDKGAAYVNVPAALMDARGLEHWQRHLLLYLMSTECGPITHEERKLSASRVLAACSVPGRGSKGRIESLRGFVDSLVDLGLVEPARGRSDCRAALYRIDLLSICRRHSGTTSLAQGTDFPCTTDIPAESSTLHREQTSLAQRTDLPCTTNRLPLHNEQTRSG